MTKAKRLKAMLCQTVCWLRDCKKPDADFVMSADPQFLLKDQKLAPKFTLRANLAEDYRQAKLKQGSVKDFARGYVPRGSGFPCPNSMGWSDF